jgi:hypothetical protein
MKAAPKATKKTDKKEIVKSIKARIIKKSDAKLESGSGASARCN